MVALEMQVCVYVCSGLWSG